MGAAAVPVADRGRAPYGSCRDAAELGLRAVAVYVEGTSRGGR
ncbi:hypothetical protein [Streptomyces sp. NPDC001843]